MSLFRAYEALSRGSSFLAALPSGALGSDDTRSGMILPPRVLGNGLRELDRLLDWLVVEAGRGAGINSAAGGRRTDQRLRHLRGALRLNDPDQARLRALERSRLCLYHCRGVVRLGDSPGADIMTSGWYDDQPGKIALRQFAIGQMLAISSEDLAEICGYYRMLADMLVNGLRPAV